MTIQFVPYLNAYIAWTTDRTQYAFGRTILETKQKLICTPRTPLEQGPSQARIAAELIASGKVSDETRLHLLDHQAWLF